MPIKETFDEAANVPGDDWKILHAILERDEERDRKQTKCQTCGAPFTNLYGTVGCEVCEEISAEGMRGQM
ncbi:MAG: hypothetical protein NVSMB52_03640 [Chloroflexota bacterium]